MSHKTYKQEFDRKHGPPPEFDSELLELINEAVKEKAEQRELNQGDTNGRDKGN
ncbi:MAG: hypothetical protein V4858_17020 [Pseudomonadota bacterium]